MYPAVIVDCYCRLSVQSIFVNKFINDEIIVESFVRCIGL